MDNLLELAHALGSYVICGEGNVSMKDKDCFWVKASGTSLDTLKKTAPKLLHLAASEAPKPPPPRTRPMSKSVKC